LVASTGKKVQDFIGLETIEVDRIIPKILIPTTAGTGSEWTAVAVVTDKTDKKKKRVGRAPCLMANTAIIDPELTLGLPKKITADTGFDVLAHAIEAYTSTLATPVTDMMCEKAIRLAGKYLRRAVKDGTDREARNGMAFANTMSGFSIAVGIVTVCHGLAHSVGGVAGTIHGETLAAMTPQTMRFSMKGNPDKYKNIGMFLRDEYINMGQDLLEDSVEEVEDLIRAIGMDNGLAAQGVKENQIEQIADGVINYMGGSIEIDPMNPVKEDLVEILKQSM
jgi:alcohol dehydrogenase class IV